MSMVGLLDLLVEDVPLELDLLMPLLEDLLELLLLELPELLLEPPELPLDDLEMEAEPPYCLLNCLCYSAI